MHRSLPAYNIRTDLKHEVALSHDRNNVLILSSCYILSFYCTRLHVDTRYVFVHANIFLPVCLCVCEYECARVCVLLSAACGAFCMFERE